MKSILNIWQNLFILTCIVCYVKPVVSSLISDQDIVVPKSPIPWTESNNAWATFFDYRGHGYETLLRICPYHPGHCTQKCRYDRKVGHMHNLGYCVGNRCVCARDPAFSLRGINFQEDEFDVKTFEKEQW